MSNVGKQKMEEPKEEKMKNQNELFITSDLHWKNFYHRNIIKYCNRPYELSLEGIAKMNGDILKQFDELPEGSTILNLGDILLNSSKTFDELKYLVDRMKTNNKKLWLVMGNHDRELSRYLKKQDFESSYDLLVALGFDRVYDKPIYMDGIIFSHEPIYNTKNCYGHTHDIDIDKDYFNHECENWAMMERVKKEAISKQKNLDIDTSKNLTGKEIDVKNYFNVCWDKHHRILSYDEVLKYFGKI